MKKQYRQQAQSREDGFILISVIVILAILTIIGVAAMFKANVETRVSASSVDQAKAFQAAKAGLAQNYADWNGTRAAEKTAIDKAVAAGTQFVDSAGTPSTSIYDETMTPDKVTGATGSLGTDAAAVDAYVTGHSNIRVYNVTPAGLTTPGTWGTGNNPQVALWAASFTKKTDPAYPYTAPNLVACPDCNIVVYALARAGNARSLQREIQGTTTYVPSDASAVNNVPNTAYWADLCNGSNGSTPQSSMNPFGVVGENPPAPPVTTATTTHEWLIEATQAPYRSITNNTSTKNFNVPSGTAFASNTAIGVGNSEFEVQLPVTNSENTSTVAVYNADPLIAYSGHHNVSSMRVDYASTARDATSPNAPDMPGGILPHQLINDKLLGTPGQLDFLNGAGQAFDLDALRWGAEQFTCRSANSGKFCGKANTLKTAVHAGRTVLNGGVLVTSDHDAAPVTGRMTFAEFQYNIANAIPMFGLVRVMYPAIPQAGAPSDCNGQSVRLYQTEDTSEKMSWSPGATDYTGSPTAKDGDGNLGPRAKLIVYGSIMIDFFADDNGDGILNSVATDGNFRFDPAAGEHILTNLENGESKAEMTVPELINPALPYAASGPLVAFPGITMNGSGPVNLASPTGGNFPLAEGMIPSVAAVALDFTAQKDGRMELMNPNASNVSKLYEIGNSVHVAGGIGTNTPSYFAAYKTRLNYYYDLAYATANRRDPNQWPMAVFPSGMSDSFCIGLQDCTLPPAGTGPNNDGDKFHLLFPSGYMHGWKVALAALNLTAADWNGILDGTDVLAGQAAANSTITNMIINKGSPFNPTLDVPMDYRLKTPPAAPVPFASLAAKATVLINDNNKNNKNNKYFYVESGSGGSGLLTSDWKDIPAFIYSGGFMQIQYVSNISGATYTPGPMSWGAEDNTSDPGTGYFNGTIITGFGFSRGGEDPGSSGYAVVAFDPQSVDNSGLSKLTPVLRRYAWQQLN